MHIARTTFGSKGHGIKGEWRQLHRMELYNLDRLNKSRIRWAGVPRVNEGGHDGKRPVGDLDTDCRIILKLV
jgi:hypothetical protein